MAEWVLVENNAIAEYHDRLPAAWRNVSGLQQSQDDLPFLKNLGWFPVVKASSRIDPQTQYITNYTYTIRENDVYEAPVIVEHLVEQLSDAELAAQAAEQHHRIMADLRDLRNQKLVQSDWSQLADIQAKFDTETKQKWLDYRQSLRDLPASYETSDISRLDQIIWPSL